MTTPSAPRRSGARIGRFRLLDELGRGAQATVWRAHDERLDREVALKLLNDDASAQPVSQWLHEARAVGRVMHPHVVPVFDADVIDGQPCLVFELVSGPTLTQWLRARGALPAREAVELMLGVVDALRAAHAQGIVHRDLKPSNILVDADGRARVMDFGIAARLAAPSTGAGADGFAGCIVGSPGYLSPEAAAGAPANPQMDVFSAGVVLAELLGGRRLLNETDPMRALRRVQDEDLQLPGHAEADDRLRAVVQRALARDPRRRYDSAASLREALAQWLAPPAEEGPLARPGHGTLDFLLRRMRHKSDFPALTEHVLRIQRMTASETDNLHQLADEILKDVALTQKLLRLVNTAHFRRSGHGVSTVSRAVALVGLGGIRNLTLSLVLVEHMKDQAHAQRLKEDFLRALLAAQLAQELCGSARDAEEAFVCGLFYNLGKLLTEYYFPDEAEAVRAQLRASPPDPAVHPDLRLDRAAAVVLGLGFEALGVGVARHWGLPDVLQRSMRRPDAGSPQQVVPPGAEHLRWLSVAANELADALWRADEAALPAEMAAIAQRHGRALRLGVPELVRAAASARSTLAQMAPALGLALPRGARGARVLAAAPTDFDAPDSLTPHQFTATVPGRAGAAAPGAVQHLAVEPLAPPPGVHDVAGMLAAGIQDITESLAADSYRLNEVLRMVLETIYRGLGFQRVVFCLRDTPGGRLLGRFGLGDRAALLAPLFQVPLRWPAGTAPDLFGAVCLKGSDTLIADSRQPAIAQRLPAWYRQQVAAPSFLLLPMVMKGAPFALIYADHAHAGSLALAELELALVRTLRNQAVMAFRQAGTPV